MLTIISLVGSLLSVGWHVYNTWKSSKSSPAMVANAQAAQIKALEDKINAHIASGNIAAQRTDAS
jgi:hypothetical protein